MSFLDRFLEVQDELTKLIEDMPKYNACDVGLDMRCGQFYSDGEIVAYKHKHNNFHYYGGFEYCSPESKTVIGDYTIFTELDQSGRIQAVLDKVLTLVENGLPVEETIQNYKCGKTMEELENGEF